MIQGYRTLALKTFLTSVAISLGSVGCGDDLRLSDGRLNFALVVSPEIRLGTVNYSVSGNGFVKDGTIDASASTELAGRIGGIPQGASYALTIAATAANDPSIKCEGRATFNVTAGAATQVAIGMQCRVAPRTGSVVINGKINLCPVIDAVDVLPAEALVGGSIALRVQARDLDNLPAPLAYSWTSSVGSVTGASASSSSTICGAAGAGTVSITVSGGDCVDTVNVPVVCTAVSTSDASMDSASPVLAAIRVNEVESSGGTPGDWAELFNAGTTVVDVSNWVFKDNDDTHVYVIAPGTTIAPGAFLTLEESAFGFGLGGMESARLFDARGNLVDSYSWTSHAPTTYGRCPDGSGVFRATLTPTKGSANSCAPLVPADAGVIGDATPDQGVPGDAAVPILPWPGLDNVTTVDTQNQFGDNLSGLTYQPAAANSPAVLWAVLNSPSLIYRLVWNGSTWASDTTNAWGAGKNLRYPSGTGNPDAEGITRAEASSSALYISTERNNDASSVSRLSVLRVDASAAGTELVASNEWNLTADLPVVGANLGLEAITWIPDAFLVANGLVDQTSNQPYNPANYANHGSGLFFVGVEGTGTIYGYALDHVSNAFTRVVSFASGHAGVMGLEFDRDTGALWAACDNTCGNANAVLGLSGGRFMVKKKYLRPSTLPDSNNEGIALASEAECTAGVKPFFWSDDSHFGGFSLRTGSVNCGPLF